MRYKKLHNKSIPKKYLHKKSKSKVVGTRKIITYIPHSLDKRKSIEFITAYNEDQKRTLYLGTGKEKNGYVQTYNRYEEPTSYIGSNRDMDGVLVLNDRYGAMGYTQSGKN